MMIARVRRWSWVWLPAAFGVLLGVLLALIIIGGASWLIRQYDELHPVVSSHLTVIATTPEHVDVRLVTTRLRACRYLPPPTVLAQQADGGDDLVLFAQRLDAPAAGTSYAVGTKVRSEWRLWPRNGARKISLWANYSCDGRPVANHLGDVLL
jgi:hypothetical protein